MNKSEKGFIPVMLTPFKDNGEIDFDGLTKLTELYIEAGSAGLFASCLSSEMFELSDVERFNVVKHVVNVTNGVIPIVATGTFGGPIAQQADFVKRIYSTGIEAVIGITSLFADEHEADEVFEANVFNLLDLTENIPMGFYECPVPYKRLLSSVQLERFADTGRVIYHKDTSLDMNQIKAKLSVIKNPDFGLYDAYMVHAVESLKAGAAGLSCIQGNFFPEMIVWLCENYNSDSLKTEVNDVQEFLIANMDVMHDVYPIVAKYSLQKRGLNISTFTRRKVGDFSSGIKNNIEQLYVDYQSLQEKIGLDAI
jgi:4-hydroxy-tetrahydrodipicolinate synthase